MLCCSLLSVLPCPLLPHSYFRGFSHCQPGTTQSSAVPSSATCPPPGLLLTPFPPSGLTWVFRLSQSLTGPPSQSQDPHSPPGALVLNPVPSGSCAAVLRPEPFCSAADGDPRRSQGSGRCSACPRPAQERHPCAAWESLFFTPGPSSISRAHQECPSGCGSMLTLQCPKEEPRSNPHLRMGLQLCPNAFIQERRLNERNRAPFLLTLPTACVLAVPRERHFVLEL